MSNGKNGKQADNRAGNRGNKAPFGKPFQKGVSGNPKGAPKRGESWAEIIKRVGELTPAEAASRSLELSKQFLKIGEGVTLKEAVVLRVYGALLFDPSAGLLNAFMERAEGKLLQPTHEMNQNEWRDWLRNHGYTDADIDSLVAEFAAAMGRRSDSAGSDAANSIQSTETDI